MGRLMTDARSLHCKEEGVVGKSDVGESEIFETLAADLITDNHRFG